MLAALGVGGVAVPYVACDDVRAPRNRRAGNNTTPWGPQPYGTGQQPGYPAPQGGGAWGTPPQGGTAGGGAPIAPGSVRLRVTFLDIGQGDAALLESADGHAAMIDTGPPEGRPHLREALAQRNVRALDWLILTHPHLDHIGGASDLLGNVRVAQVIDPGFPHPIATYDRLLARIQELGITFVRAQTGGALALGAGAQLEVLQPHQPFISGTRSDVNSNSVVARVTAGNVRVLFTGDSERETEERLLRENAGQLQADVLKVAHHGSRYASTPEFLAAVSPRYAVISCGQDNDYGHPHAETLQSLAQRQIAFFRTDLQGDVTLTTDGAQIAFATARGADPSAMMTPGAHERRQSQ